MEKVKEIDSKCIKCGHEWLRREKKPLKCPSCKARHWEDLTRHKATPIYKKEEMESDINIGEDL